MTNAVFVTVYTDVGENSYEDMIMKQAIGKFLLALMIFTGILFGGIYLISELTWFHGSLIGNVVDSDVQPTPTITPRTYSIVYEEEVPERIANRGIILMGGDREPKYRAEYPSRYNTDGSNIWFYDYMCDCNLKVPASDDEFRAYCERFSQYGEVTFNGFGTDQVCFIKVPNYNLPDTHYAYVYIYRTCYGYSDYSDGYVLYDGDPGYGVPIYYDPTGKYIMEIDGQAPIDELYLEFIEPEMVSVDLNSSYADSLHFEDAETVGIYVDAIHELHLSIVEEDRSELAMAENYIVLSFTDVNGYTNDYKIVGQYLIHGEDIYYVDNPDKLDVLTGFTETPPEAEEASELPENGEG
ncbi:MAG: hypothetical protein J6I66_09755 [Lachnospiraceae bacterium]|nr:hypothetical protein [Lachnospiraceae bacterium]